MADDFDLYSDLIAEEPPQNDSNNNGSDPEKLQYQRVVTDCISAATDLQQEQTRLLDENGTLKKQNITLKRNVSALFKTAKAELARKEKEIAELKRRVLMSNRRKPRAPPPRHRASPPQVATVKSEENIRVLSPDGSPAIVPKVKVEPREQGKDVTKSLIFTGARVPDDDRKVAPRTSSDKSPRRGRGRSPVRRSPEDRRGGAPISSSSEQKSAHRRSPRHDDKLSARKSVFARLGQTRREDKSRGRRSRSRSRGRRSRSRSQGRRSRSRSRGRNSSRSRSTNRRDRSRRRQSRSPERPNSRSGRISRTAQIRSRDDVSPKPTARVKSVHVEDKVDLNAKMLDMEQSVAALSETVFDLGDDSPSLNSNTVILGEGVSAAEKASDQSCAECVTTAPQTTRGEQDAGERDEIEIVETNAVSNTEKVADTGGNFAVSPLDTSMDTDTSVFLTDPARSPIDARNTSDVSMTEVLMMGSETSGILSSSRVTTKDAFVDQTQRGIDTDTSDTRRRRNSLVNCDEEECTDLMECSNDQLIASLNAKNGTSVPLNSHGNGSRIPAPDRNTSFEHDSLKIDTSTPPKSNSPHQEDLSLDEVFTMGSENSAGKVNHEFMSVNDLDVAYVCDLETYQSPAKEVKRMNEVTTDDVNEMKKVRNENDRKTSKKKSRRSDECQKLESSKSTRRSKSSGIADLKKTPEVKKLSKEVGREVTVSVEDELTNGSRRKTVPTVVEKSGSDRNQEVSKVTVVVGTEDIEKTDPETPILVDKSIVVSEATEAVCSPPSSETRETKKNKFSPRIVLRTPRNPRRSSRQKKKTAKLVESETELSIRPAKATTGKCKTTKPAVELPARKHHVSEDIVDPGKDLSDEEATKALLSAVIGRLDAEEAKQNSIENLAGGSLVTEKCDGDGEEHFELRVEVIRCGLDRVDGTKISTDDKNDTAIKESESASPLKDNTEPRIPESASVEKKSPGRSTKTHVNTSLLEQLGLLTSDDELEFEVETGGNRVETREPIISKTGIDERGRELGTRSKPRPEKSDQATVICLSSDESENTVPVFSTVDTIPLQSTQGNAQNVKEIPDPFMSPDPSSARPNSKPPSTVKTPKSLASLTPLWTATSDLDGAEAAYQFSKALYDRSRGSPSSSVLASGISASPARKSSTDEASTSFTPKRLAQTKPTPPRRNSASQNGFLVEESSTKASVVKKSRNGANTGETKSPLKDGSKRAEPDLQKKSESNLRQSFTDFCEGSTEKTPVRRVIEQTPQPSTSKSEHVLTKSSPKQKIGKRPVVRPPRSSKLKQQQTGIHKTGPTPGLVKKPAVPTKNSKFMDMLLGICRSGYFDRPIGSSVPFETMEQKRDVASTPKKSDSSELNGPGKGDSSLDTLVVTSDQNVTSASRQRGSSTDDVDVLMVSDDDDDRLQSELMSERMTEQNESVSCARLLPVQSLTLKSTSNHRKWSSVLDRDKGRTTTRGRSNSRSVSRHSAHRSEASRYSSTSRRSSAASSRDRSSRTSSRRSRRSGSRYARSNTCRSCSSRSGSRATSRDSSRCSRSQSPCHDCRESTRRSRSRDDRSPRNSRSPFNRSPIEQSARTPREVHPGITPKKVVSQSTQTPSKSRVGTVMSKTRTPREETSHTPFSTPLKTPQKNRTDETITHGARTKISASRSEVISRGSDRSSAEIPETPGKHLNLFSPDYLTDEARETLKSKRDLNIQTGASWKQRLADMCKSENTDYSDTDYEPERAVSRESWLNDRLSSDSDAEVDGDNNDSRTVDTPRQSDSKENTRIGESRRRMMACKSCPATPRNKSERTHFLSPSCKNSQTGQRSRRPFESGRTMFYSIEDRQCGTANCQDCGLNSDRTLRRVKSFNLGPTSSTRQGVTPRYSGQTSSTRAHVLSPKRKQSLDRKHSNRERAICSPERRHSAHGHSPDRRHSAHDHSLGRRCSAHGHSQRHSAHEHLPDRRQSAHGHSPDRRHSAHGHSPDRRHSAHGHSPDRRHSAHGHSPDRRHSAHGHSPDRRHSAHGHSPDRRHSAHGHSPDRRHSAHEHSPDRRHSAHGHSPDRSYSAHGHSPDRRHSAHGHSPDRRHSAHGHSPDRRHSAHGLSPDRRHSAHGHSPDRRHSAHGHSPDRRHSAHGHSPDRRHSAHGHSPDRRHSAHGNNLNRGHSPVSRIEGRVSSPYRRHSDLSHEHTADLSKTAKKSAQGHSPERMSSHPSSQYREYEDGSHSSYVSPDRRRSSHHHSPAGDKSYHRHSRGSRSSQHGSPERSRPSPDRARSAHVNSPGRRRSPYRHSPAREFQRHSPERDSPVRGRSPDWHPDLENDSRRLDTSRTSPPVSHGNRENQAGSPDRESAKRELSFDANSRLSSRSERRGSLTSRSSSEHRRSIRLVDGIGGARRPKDASRIDRKYDDNIERMADDSGNERGVVHTDDHYGNDGIEPARQSVGEQKLEDQNRRRSHGATTTSDQRSRDRDRGVAAERRSAVETLVQSDTASVKERSVNRLRSPQLAPGDGGRGHAVDEKPSSSESDGEYASDENLDCLEEELRHLKAELQNIPETERSRPESERFTPDESNRTSVLSHAHSRSPRFRQSPENVRSPCTTPPLRSPSRSMTASVPGSPSSPRPPTDDVLDLFDTATHSPWKVDGESINTLPSRTRLPLSFRSLDAEEGEIASDEANVTVESKKPENGSMAQDLREKLRRKSSDQRRSDARPDRRIVGSDRHRASPRRSSDYRSPRRRSASPHRRRRSPRDGASHRRTPERHRRPSSRGDYRHRRSRSPGHESRTPGRRRSPHGRHHRLSPSPRRDHERRRSPRRQRYTPEPQSRSVGRRRSTERRRDQPCDLEVPASRQQYHRDSNSRKKPEQVANRSGETKSVSGLSSTTKSALADSAKKSAIRPSTSKNVSGESFLLANAGTSSVSNESIQALNTDFKIPKRRRDPSVSVGQKERREQTALTVKRRRVESR